MKNKKYANYGTEFEPNQQQPQSNNLMLRKYLFQPDGKRKLIAFVCISMVILIGAGCWIFSLVTNYQKERTYTNQVAISNKAIANTNYDTAIIDYQKAIQMKSDDEKTYLGLAAAYIGKEDYTNAVKTLKIGYKKTQSSSINAKINELTALLDKKNKATEDAQAEATKKAAEAAAQKAIQEQFANQLALGDKYFASKNFDSAMSVYQKAILTSPNNEKPYIGMANCYIAKQDYKSAERILTDGYSATKSAVILSKQKQTTSEKEILLLKNFSDKMPKSIMPPKDFPADILPYNGAIIIDTNGDGHYELIASYDQFLYVYVVDNNKVVSFKGQDGFNQHIIDKTMAGTAANFRFRLVKNKKSQKVYFEYYECLGNICHDVSENITDTIFSINDQKIENIEQEKQIFDFIRNPNDGVRDNNFNYYDDSNIKQIVNGTLVTAKNEKLINSKLIENRYQDWSIPDGLTVIK